MHRSYLKQPRFESEAWRRAVAALPIPAQQGDEDDIVAFVAVEQVLVLAADDPVVAGAAARDVIAAVAVDVVEARAPGQAVVAVLATQDVGAAQAPVDAVIASRCDHPGRWNVVDKVVVTKERVRSHPTLDIVIAGATLGKVITISAGDEIVPGIGIGNEFGTAGPTVIAKEVVVATATEQHIGTAIALRNQTIHAPGRGSIARNRGT